MKIEVKGYNLPMIERVSKITGTSYLDDDDFIEVDTLMDIISDLEDKYNELKQRIETEYEPKKFDPYLEYGVSESDFH
jgi:hypothetical protein